LGIDYDKHLGQLDMSTVKAALKSGLTEGKFKVGNVWAVMKDGVIVTFLPAD
jgi:hypothetical protein